VGNANGAVTNHVTGASGAGPIFFDVMKRAMESVGSRGAVVDASTLEEAEVCPLSGERPGSACADHVTRRFARGMSPTVTCTMHRHATPRAAPAGAAPFACSEVPQGPVIVVLPDTFTRFLGERAPGAPGLDAHGTQWFLASSVPGCALAAPTTSFLQETGPRVVLVQPHSGATFHADEAPPSADVVEVVATTEGLPSATALEVLVDGKVTLSLAPPYKGLVPITRGEHSVEVRPRDARLIGRVARAEISVR
jgi:penicillin-binding protein 1C